MINSNQLLLVRAIISAGSVTRAADVLHLTQSAVSHQLRELETGLGLKVFERIGKKLIPTPLGQIIIQRMDTIISELKKLNDDILQLKNGKSRTIRISTECYTCYTWLPEIIVDFKAEFPSVHIEIVAEATRQPLEFLLNGKLDIAIFECNPRSEGIHLLPLFKDELIGVVSKKHLYGENKKFLVPDDFSGQDLVYYDLPVNQSSILSNLLTSNGIVPGNIMRMQLTEAMIDMIEANLGIGVMANWIVKPFLKTKKITTIPLKTPLRKRQWYAGIMSKRDPLLYEFAKAIQRSRNKPPSA